jgi:hypothetical protein
MLEGRERESGEVMRILYAGQLEAKNYIAHLAFAEPPNETRSGEVRVRRALQWQPDEVGASLVVADVERSFYARICPGKGSCWPERRFLIPCWVGGSLDVARILNRHRETDKVHGDLRKIRKNRLDFTVTRESDAFDHFYHTMYLPHMNRVYGDRAFLMSHEEMRQWQPKSELFLICRDGEIVAGQILVFDDEGRVRAWSVGVKDGDLDHVKAGAVAALYHFEARYLQARGYVRCDVGASRPFLRDGVLQYKHKWGLDIETPGDRLFVLRVDVDSAGSRAFLHHNPFIYLDGEVLRGATFRNAGETSDPLACERLRKDYLIPGIADLQLFDLDARGDASACVPTIAPRAMEH